MLLQSRVALLGSVQAKIRPNIIFIDLEPLSHLNKTGLYTGGKLNVPGLKRLMAKGSSVNKSLSYHHEAPGLSKSLKGSSYKTYHVGSWDIPGKSAREHFTVFHEGGWCGELNDQDVTSGARSFLRNYEEADPFFLSVAYLEPGECCLPKGESFPPKGEGFSQKGQGQLPDEENYPRYVERLGLEIELVLDELERSRYRENTIILYAWSHGEGIECLFAEKLI